MESFNKIDAYVATVQDQIRCRKIRSYVTEEIRVHLEEERSFLLEAGISDPEATDTAIEEMGDPVDIGVKLDRIHRCLLYTSSCKRICGSAAAFLPCLIRLKRL